MPEYRVKASISGDEKMALERRAAKEGTTVSALIRDALRMQHAQQILDDRRDEIFGAIAAQADRMEALKIEVSRIADALEILAKTKE